MLRATIPFGRAWKGRDEAEGVGKGVLRGKQISRRSPSGMTIRTADQPGRSAIPLTLLLFAVRENGDQCPDEDGPNGSRIDEAGQSEQTGTARRHESERQLFQGSKFPADLIQSQKIRVRTES